MSRWLDHWLRPPSFDKQRAGNKGMASFKGHKANDDANFLKNLFNTLSPIDEDH